jgi:hypothetical protein
MSAPQGSRLSRDLTPPALSLYLPALSLYLMV